MRVFQITDPNEWGSAPGSSPPVSPALALVGFLGLCLLVGAADSAVAFAQVHSWYSALKRPPGTPVWLFGPVLSALYAWMGAAAWLVWRRAGAGLPLRLWGWQLAACALWTPALFGLHSPLLALVDTLAFAALLVATIRGFTPIHHGAAWMMVPYLLWTGYALYLNAGICWLNPA